MSEPFSVINGEFVPASQARVGIGDLAIQRGYGCFDFFRTIAGKPVFWDDHLDRLDRSTQALRLTLPYDRATLKGMLAELMRRNGIPDGGIRITVTGGPSHDAYSIASPSVLMTQQVMKINPDPTPLHLITHEHQRQMPGVKTIDYLMAIWLQPTIRERGAQDVLYHGPTGISECPRSNFFAVTEQGTLITPAQNMLPGITRGRVLKLAQQDQKVEVRDIAVEELKTIREAFITGTSKQIVPVTKIDDRTVGDGAVGQTTRHLMHRMNELLAAEVDGDRRS